MMGFYSLTFQSATQTPAFIELPLQTESRSKNSTGSKSISISVLRWSSKGRKYSAEAE